MASLRLGPLLRHVGETTATVWVETDRPATVTVLDTTTSTWRVGAHHYALVVIEGLEPGSSTPYDVRLDGERVWPPAGSSRPPSRITTIHPDRPLRVIFGSCRYASPATVQGPIAADALDTYAARMATRPGQEWPDLLVLLGDQVYADETSEQTREIIAKRRDTTRPPGTEVADFEEYTALYDESWTDPDLRWLLSTVPSAMIFDDHDVKDDWNTSQSWREEMQATDWWEERIIGGLSSYWVYQHLGNLSPAELADNELFAKVRAAEDAEPILREFARHADQEVDGAKGTRWSYRRDLGRTRLLVVDSRCGRVLADGRRAMVSDDEFGWIERQVEGGDYDHLLIGTSLPWLMPRALHDVESWDEALAAGSRGPRFTGIAEKMRRGADMEHWAAFRRSFDRLAALIARVGRGEHGGRPPATICVLSGDVHHAYVTRARYPDPVESAVYQVVCSPVHNHVQAYMHLGFRLGWSRAAEKLTRWIGRYAKVPPTPLDWQKLAGPFFGNELGTLLLDGRRAEVLLERTGSADNPTLTDVVRLPL